MIRRVVACCQPHEFLGTPGDLRHGVEVIAASGYTEDSVNEKLRTLLHQHGWTKRDGEGWQCAKHDVRPLDATRGFTLAKSRSAEVLP